MTPHARTTERATNRTVASADRRRTAETVRYTIARSSLGHVLVAQGDAGICAVLLGDDDVSVLHDLRTRFASATLVQDDATLETFATEVVRCIESPARELRMPLDMRGSEFQRDVWRALRAVPAGSTTTYTDVAIRIGRPASVRAVAQACAANPLAVIVPCHRVLRRDGQLSGYRWGVERKRALLDRESSA